MRVDGHIPAMGKQALLLSDTGNILYDDIEPKLWKKIPIPIQGSLFAIDVCLPTVSIVPLLSPPSVLTQRHHSWYVIKLDNIGCSAQRIPWNSASPKSRPRPSHI